MNKSTTMITYFTALIVCIPKNRTCITKTVDYQCHKLMGNIFSFGQTMLDLSSYYM